MVEKQKSYGKSEAQGGRRDGEGGTTRRTRCDLAAAAMVNVARMTSSAMVVLARAFWFDVARYRLLGGDE